MKQKTEQYDKFVKEVHPAKAHSSKTKELEALISHLKHPMKSRKEKYDNYLSEIRAAKV